MLFRVIALTLLLTAPALAQFGTRAPIAPDRSAALAGRLPAPPVHEDADSVEFLRAAEAALAAGRTGEAQEAMEMAQTRLLHRSVPLGETDRPSDNPAVRLIAQALHALEEGDRATSLRMIQAAAMEVVKQR